MVDQQESISNDAADEENGENQDAPPAVTIVIQSWATPIIGITMLVLGLVAGFFLRPVILPERQVAAETIVQNQSSAPVATPAINPDADEIMRVVTAQTRHFIGDENAPVTMIEFSDFQ